MKAALSTTELSILKAIDTWHEHIRPLFDVENECPNCPKRFIYGCFCSYERMKIEESLQSLVEKHYLQEVLCTRQANEVCYRKV